MDLAKIRSTEDFFEPTIFTHDSRYLRQIRSLPFARLAKSFIRFDLRAWNLRRTLESELHATCGHLDRDIACLRTRLAASIADWNREHVQRFYRLANWLAQQGRGRRVLVAERTSTIFGTRSYDNAMQRIGCDEAVYANHASPCRTEMIPQMSDDSS